MDTVRFLAMGITIVVILLLYPIVIVKAQNEKTVKTVTKVFAHE